MTPPPKRMTFWRILRLIGWRHPVQVWRQWRLWGRRPLGPVISINEVNRIVKSTFGKPHVATRTRAQVLEDMVKGSRKP